METPVTGPDGWVEKPGMAADLKGEVLGTALSHVAGDSLSHASGMTPSADWTLRLG